MDLILTYPWQDPKDTQTLNQEELEELSMLEILTITSRIGKLRNTSTNLEKLIELLFQNHQKEEEEDLLS